jgi:hypothetical protein
VDAADLLIFQIIDKTIINSKFHCLSEATPYYHNVFTFTLFLQEGRACVAWEPSNKMMLYLPLGKKIKYLSLHPLISSLNLLFGRLQSVKLVNACSWRCQNPLQRSYHLVRSCFHKTKQCPPHTYRFMTFTSLYWQRLQRTRITVMSLTAFLLIKFKICILE